MARIEPYQHRCIVQSIVQSGDLAGNKRSQDVDPVEPVEVEYAITCDNCGEVLATPEQIIAHIYGELLRE